MRPLEFTLKTITPMFMAGADGKTFELRPPSVKGAMRFWWRAMNGHLSLEELRIQEAEIFGDSGEKGRSKVIIRLRKIEEVGKKSISLTPHHRKGYCDKDKKNCFYRNGKCMKANLQKGVFYNFNLRLDYQSDIRYIEKNLESLIKLMFILGGFGKRSRRGFGSVRINKINDKIFDFDYSINSVLNLLNSIENDVFKIENNKIVRNNPANREANYPYIKEIEIGKQYSDYKEILIKTGESSHDYRNNSLGFAFKGKRFASPIYVSIIKVDNSDRPYRPVITTLNTAFENQRSVNTKKQKQFKEAIL